LSHRRLGYFSSSTINGTTAAGHVIPDIRVWRYSYTAESGWISGAYERLYRQAYDKLVSFTHDKASASAGVSLVEMRESLTMIHKRATQLLQFTVALAKRDFGGVVRALGLSKDEAIRLRGKAGVQARKERTRRLKSVWDAQAVKPASFANNFLEYVFGWAPMVKDIQDAITVLNRSHPAEPVSAKAEETLKEESTVDPYMSWDGYVPYSHNTYTHFYRVRLQVSIRVTNPNLLLAHDLGLINPVAVAWQVVPFSFLVDWFIPIGKYLSSYTDWVGLELENTFQSRLYDGFATNEVRYEGYAGRGTEVRRAQGYAFERDVPYVLTVPSLHTRIGLPTGDLLGKAVSSMALLIQQLSNRK